MFDHFTHIKAFYKSQYGFRKYHSTEFATLELVDRITSIMDNNKLPINVYLDLSKAFDTLDHQILLHKLKYYGITGNSLNLLQNYLSNRSQQVEFNNIISDPLVLKCGVPQGSILGPLLFIVYINDISQASNYFYPILYADDTTLCATLNSSWNSIDITILNNELSAVNTWLKLNKLSLNVLKTKAMVFHTAQRHVNYPDLFIDGHKIEFVSDFNFLGIVLNENLKWKSHIDMISNKISKTLGIMKKLKNTLPESALLNIYNALVLSYLNYGIIVWGIQTSKLFKLQKMALRIIGKSKFNAHTSPLFKKFRLLKIADLSALHDLKFCYKFENGTLPEYFLFDMPQLYVHSHHHQTRGQHNIRLPAVSHEFAKNSISYKFPKTFNNMDPLIKSKIYTHSFEGFRNYVKNKFIDGYPVTCLSPNCYICGN